MSIAEEYERQAMCRGWRRYIEKIPIHKHDTVLDLGCGTGDVSVLLADRVAKVTAIDSNKELIQYAEQCNAAGNIQYVHHDIRDIDRLNMGNVNGIWASFTPAYFPDFKPLLQTWLSLLKQGGWIALTEVNDLFAHEPMDNKYKDTFRLYYEKQRTNNVYDFEMGEKLKDFLIKSRITIHHEENMFDPELSGNGIAGDEIIALWEARFHRMKGLHHFFGEADFCTMRKQFLENLKKENHSSDCKVVYVVGVKI